MNTIWVSHFKQNILSDKTKPFLRLIILFMMMIALGSALALYADSPWLIIPFLGALALTSFAALDYALYILVAFLPFSFRFIMLRGTEMQVPTEPLLAIMAVALFLRWIVMGRREVHIKFPLRLPILLYIISLYLSMINSGRLYYSAKGSLRLVAYVMLSFVVYNVITDRRRLKWLFIVSIVPATVAVGWTMIFLVDRLDQWRWTSAYEGLLFTSYVHYGAFVAVILLILLGRWIFDRGRYNRVNWTILTGFYAAAICLSFSRGVWVSLVAAIGFMIIQRSEGIQNKRILITVGAIAFLAILLSIPHISGLIMSRIMSIANMGYATNRERVLRWGTALLMFSRHPIVGCGYGSFAFTYVNDPSIVGVYLSQYGTGAHSEYMQTLAETGLLGFSAWMWIIVSYYLYGFRLLKKLRQGGDGIGGRGDMETRGYGDTETRRGGDVTSPDRFFYRSLAIGVMAAATSLLVHFFVNNLIQADIVGVPFWLLIGLLPAIGNIVEKENQAWANGKDADG